MSVQTIQDKVTHLSKEELEEFSKWFEEYMADRWDEQIERDILAGKWDAAGQRAMDDMKAGRCTPL